MIVELLKHIFSLKSFATRLLNDNTHDAEDALQDLSIRLWNKKEFLETLPLIEQKKYACISLSNICTDYHRRCKASNSPCKRGHTEELKSWHEGVAYEYNSLEDKESKNILKNAIRNLRNKDRKLMLIMFLDGYKCREIALILRTPIHNVTAGIRGARLNVKESIKNYYYDKSNGFQE